jgi:tetratricopeptide (TPR) repeat protein
MKLFGIDFGSDKPKQLRITEADRQWVENNFQWLVDVFGHPTGKQIIISEKYFPKTFSTKELRIENLLDDCCFHLHLDSKLFSYRIYSDIRDADMPYATADRPLDCLLEFDKESGRYSMLLAKDIFNHPTWLIASVCYEISRARLIESKVEYDSGSDTDLFLYLAAVYFGYGVVIAQNLTNIGNRQDILWQRRWAYISDMPYPVMAYALATFSKVSNELNPEWNKLLSQEVREEFDLSIAFMKTSDNKLFDAQRIDDTMNADKLFELSCKLYESNKIEKAITMLEKIILISEDEFLKSNVYNNIGYYKLRLGKYESSIPDFTNAIELDPDNAYAHDNLGFALIMSGNLAEGKLSVERAVKTKNNDGGYSFRNMALYYQKSGDFDNAEKYFKKAFSEHSPVDLLDFYYGQFLLEIGNREEGIRHIKLSAELGEQEGISLLVRLR